MKDIKINCPNNVHKRPHFNHKTKENEVKTKMLCIVSDDTVGTIKMQCQDSMCKKSNPESNGWYQIDINSNGGIKIKELKKKLFRVQNIPLMVEDLNG